MASAPASGRSPKRFHHVVSPTPGDCREARIQLGWTPDQLAEAAGLTLRTVVTYEQGLRTPHPRTLLAIRRALRSAGAAADPRAAQARPG
jgi:transcriptional regulator with XRE-family HTH domain